MGSLAPVPDPAPLIPPQNLEAEEAVLGAAMLSPGAIASCREILRDDGREFYRESHTRIWRAIIALADRGEPVDAITLTDDLEERGHLEDVGGRVRIHELAALVPATANAGHYARIVVDQAQRRDLIVLGGEISRLGWDTPGEAAALVERARALTDQLDDTGAASPITVESWAQFERSATETIPMLIDGLWPEDGLGILGAPPKKGKTWVALDLAIAVATGTPFLSHFPVPAPQPVVLLAAEGHRSAIRGRIGALAHGHGLNPQTDERLRRNLHIVYKPAGLNLADPAWIRTTRDLVKQTGARLLIVDVLRAAAVLKENSNDEFRDLFRALAPLQADGCALALLHHFGKLTELSKDRTPGERLAGAGAIYGAFDVGVFITKSDQGARELRLEFETRDVVAPEPLGVHLDGNPTGPLGGFVFSDTATWRVLDEPPEDDDETGAAAFIEWLQQQPDEQARTSEVVHGFCSDRTIRRRRLEWENAGVIYTPHRGKTEALYSLPVGGHRADTARADSDRPHDVTAQETLDLQEEPTLDPLDRPRADTNTDRPQETPDLQALPWAARADSPTESSTRTANAAATAPQEHDATTHNNDSDDIDWTAP